MSLKDVVVGLREIAAFSREAFAAQKLASRIRCDS